VRSFASAAVALACFLAPTLAEGQATPSSPPPETDEPPAAAGKDSETDPEKETEPESERAWSFSASAYAYIIPGEKDYVQPTVTADRGWLHLEARYNYEDLETGSLWVGYNFGIGEKLKLEFTPMFGGAFGDTNGIAPGYKGSLGWWWLELYSEGEYLFDLEESSDSFFYTWSELTLSPLEWLRFGLVTQRTRAYEGELDVQRGFLVGLSYKQLDFTAHVFNLGWEEPTYVFSLGVNF